MNEELKQKWTTALRSGEYVQGRGLLRSPSDEYCCLGVLCDINGEGRWTETGSDKIPVFQLGYAEEDQDFGYAFRRHFGLSGQDTRQLVNMNDRENNFDVIADWIDENL